MHEGAYLQWISLVSPLVSIVGVILVLIQLRRGSIQREAQSLVQVFDINRQLLTLGFSHPDLFKVLHDQPVDDALREEHYLQLWFNQMWLIHLFLKQSIFKAEVREALLSAVAEFATQDNFLRLWQRKREFYPESFRELVDAFIKEKELSAPQIAPEYSDD